MVLTVRNHYLTATVTLHKPSLFQAPRGCALFSLVYTDREPGTGFAQPLDQYLTNVTDQKGFPWREKGPKLSAWCVIIAAWGGLGMVGRGCLIYHFHNALRVFSFRISTRDFHEWWISFETRSSDIKSRQSWISTPVKIEIRPLSQISEYLNNSGFQRTLQHN